MSYVFEGPPSPIDMESVCTDLLWRGSAPRAHALASTMVDWWLAQPRTGDIVADSDRSSRFYLWLGMCSVLSAIVGRAEHRKVNRAASRVSRRSR